jgi:peroxiredoxin
MIRFIILLFLFEITSCKSSSDKGHHATVSSTFYDINLNTLSNESINLSKIKESRGAVLFFMSPECPICQNYSLTINDIIEKYKDKNIGFYGIFPGTYYKSEQVQKYLDDYKMEFIPLLDKKFLLTKNIHATVMPEAFVLDASGNILYHGCIDNWFYSLGHHRSVITEYYVVDALENLINNNGKVVNNTEAIGCFIE